MSKKWKIVFAGAMTASLILTACSEKTEEKPADSAKPAETGAAGKEVKFPLQEKVTLKAVARRPPLAPSDLNQLEIAKKIEKNTNVHIQWDTIVETDYNEKKNLLLASNNLPDLFFGANFTDNELLKYGQDGTIIALNGLIDNHMPNLKALFAKRPDIKAEVTAPDGKIYSLPSGEELGAGQSEIGANPDFLYVNQQWLDNLGLAMPTTLDEYYQVLKAFKTKDPNKNGKQDEIPLSYINNFWTGDIGYLFGAFGVPDKTYQPGNNAFAEHLNVENGKVTYAALQPKYKEAVAYFHKWFEEGLVDVESFTQEYTQYFAKGKAKEEILGSFLWWDKTDVVGPERDKHYPLVKPFKDMVVKWNSGSAISRAGSVITKVNKNPELTAAWLDTMYDPVTASEARWGPVGVWFDEAKDAQGRLVQKKDLPNPGEFRQKVALSNGIGVITGQDFEKVVAPEARAQQRMDDIKNIFVPQMQKEKYPNLFFKPEELKVIERVKPEIQTYTNKMRAQWLLKGGVEKEWANYEKSLKNMGIDDLMKVYQEAYDRYKAAQK